LADGHERRGLGQVEGGATSNQHYGFKWGHFRLAHSLDGVHFHDLRGFAATMAAISGATTAELMRRLGHATPDMALRYQLATAARDAAVAWSVSRLVSEGRGVDSPTR